ncbi:hypothetical protein PYW07_009556 [Mythimna separata]|uniref:Uncharacterized protein n=1 Tax=Mythimna separata TaxID=271217 RepID=A0AAD7YCG9_MYTSE|nr:hypothetical protein PYW07_009556 [Mythimna separata]
MILAFGYYLVITALILLFTIFLLILTISLYVKIKLEPVKVVCTSNVRLDGKIALVTGGNQGIGLETARDLAARGARVLIACRDAKKAAEAIADIAATTGNNLVEYRPLDLARFSSVRQFAEDFNSSYDRLDILVNNAGCGGRKPKLTEDGIDEVMQANYFGAFLLTNLLLDKVIASKPSRIVMVSSWVHLFARLRVENLHKFGGIGYLGQFFTYSNSKLCQVLWTKALAKRLPEGVTVNSLHPGVVKSNFYQSIPVIGRKLVHFLCELMYKMPKEGAQTTIHLCVSEEVEGVRGKYFMECKEAEYNTQADDDELVEQVWYKSLKVTGLAEEKLSVHLSPAFYVKQKFEPVKGVCTSKVRLDGKIALVTGGNQGIGLETARDLAARGARVLIACRDAKKAAEAIADIAATTGNNLVEYRPLDLARFSSVRQFAEDFNSSYDRLDILVNNAGYGGRKPKLTEDGIDEVMQLASQLLRSLPAHEPAAGQSDRLQTQ